MTANRNGCIFYYPHIYYYVCDIYSEKIYKYKTRRAKGVSRDMFNSTWLLNGLHSELHGFHF